MSNIAAIDKNFALATAREWEGLQFRPVLSAPFRVYGLSWDGEGFCRIPRQIAQEVSPGVLGLYRNTAGGRVCFRSESSRVAIRARMTHRCLMSHMTFVGSSGFDLYERQENTYRYLGSFIPPTDRGDEFTACLELGSRRKRELLIHFPLYNNVDALSVGLEPDAPPEAPRPYCLEKPVLFYGSSITQGGCASRPGNGLTNLISRLLDADHRNLGFSGSAMGEQAMAQYIARQELSVCFLDYDHNSPPEQLKQRHEAFFLTIREQNPDLPIVLASRAMIPRTDAMTAEFDFRRQVIRTTYENALKRGDSKVSFLDGREVYPRAEALGVPADSCTVDGIHPNDLGFVCMATAYAEAIAPWI